MYLVISIMFVVIVALSASVVYGFYWAAKDGQFDNVKAGGLCIFDADEPVGKTTDHFPGETWGQKKPSKRKASS
jgi:cbb3-type cytochrome oxidase maturation protein